MIKQCLLACCAALCMIPPDAASGGIIMTLVNPANGHTYHLLTPNTWTASQAEAVSLGGNLVTINDQAENDWVFNSFKGDGITVRSLWIGLTDNEAYGGFESFSQPNRKRDGWVWVSGEPFIYSNWAGPEPNNHFGDEDFVHFYTSNYGNAWNDATNDGRDIADRIYGVVEITAIPEPSSTALLGSLLMFRFASRWSRRWRRLKNFDPE